MSVSGTRRDLRNENCDHFKIFGTCFIKINIVQFGLVQISTIFDTN